MMLSFMAHQVQVFLFFGLFLRRALELIRLLFLFHAVAVGVAEAVLVVEGVVVVLLVEESVGVAVT